MTLRLSNQSLSLLPEMVGQPSYDRSALTPGIVHIGVGNFHRAHQAMYLDELFATGRDHNWALIGAGVRPEDKAMRDNLAAQDFLTTVVELDPTGLKARICGSMIGFVEPESKALIEALVAPHIRITSLTVTEGGYYIDAKTGGFNVDHPEIIADIENPNAPKTVFGIIVAALARRREAEIDAFTIMSCDNLPGNGHVAQNAVLGFATAISRDLGAWIENNVSFPNGMVDCITPATTERERTLVADTFGIEDARPVICEPFRQWVLEDKFVGGRPALEAVGVEFVEDVAPYELMKLRILNGGHAAIAYPAALLGIEMVHDAMNDPQILGYLRKIERDEIIPVVPQITGVDFDQYLTVIEKRFSNSAVADTIPRLCQDGSNRQPKFILPSIADRIATGRSITGLALEVALWCRYCAGTNEAGQQIKIDDPMGYDLTKHALRARDTPSAFLELGSVFGPLGQEAAFREAFSSALTCLWTDGVRATLAAYLDGA